MKKIHKFSYAILLIGSLAATPSASASIINIPGFTAAANGTQTDSFFDFPSTISGEDSVYLTATVSWTTSDIGTFTTRFALDAGGRRGRGGFQTLNDRALAGFHTTDYIQTPIDPDGAGNATNRPGLTNFDTSSHSSITLVMKVDQTQTSPGGDWWFADAGKQSQAGLFMWVDPNLTADEASQFTPLAMWRDGNSSYKSVFFRTDTRTAVLTFSNINVYTGADTPFNKPFKTIQNDSTTLNKVQQRSTPPNTVPEPSSAPLIGIGGLTLSLRHLK